MSRFHYLPVLFLVILIPSLSGGQTPGSSVPGATQPPPGFKSVFNGRDFEGWTGELANYEVKDGSIVCKPGKGGTIFSNEEFGNFVVRLEFKLPPGGNNGLAIRYPGKGAPHLDGMCECQVLDSENPKYAAIDPRQAHGSAYGMVAAKRRFLRPCMHACPAVGCGSSFTSILSEEDFWMATGSLRSPFLPSPTRSPVGMPALSVASVLLAPSI